jgi:hypothetical protein
VSLEDVKTWLDEQVTRRPRLIIALYVVAMSVIACVAYDTRQKIVDSEAGRKQSIAIRQNGRASEPLITLNFRADFLVPELERRGIEKAIVDLDRVSCGLAKVNVVWDYSRERDLPRAALRGDNVIQGVSVLDVETSLGREDADDLLGMTRSAKNPRWNPVWIFLVNDRLEEDAQLAEWTVLHELGHALGMDHVKNGLMEPRAPFFFGLEDRPEWSVEDQNEFCRIYKCDPGAFIRCEVQ